MKYDFKKESDGISARVRLNKLIADQSTAELKKLNPTRTIRQNSYLHVCISLTAIEMGYSLAECKVHLKRKCSFMTYEKNGEKFLRRSSKMQTDELGKWIEFIRNYASINLGLYIPDADEYKMNMIYIDNQINQHKEYL